MNIAATIAFDQCKVKLSNEGSFAARLADYLKNEAQILLEKLRLRRDQRIARQAFQTMLYLDDKTLRDIGVTHEEVVQANNLPVERSAAQELRRILLERRARGKMI